MGDEELWQQAVAQTTRKFSLFDPQMRQNCCSILETVVHLKEQLCRFAEGVGGADICSQCGGACCVRGKYHFTIADLLVFLCRQIPLPLPEFSRFPDCPWLREAGCQLPAGLRPFTCVVFNCELIEDRMTEERLETFYQLERQLRDCYADLGTLMGERPIASLLCTIERRSAIAPVQCLHPVS
jgi:hypothetical protein